MSETRGPGVVCFHCDDCDTRWLDVSRDWQSPSGDDCPVCGCWCHSHRATTEEFDALCPVREVSEVLRSVPLQQECDK